MAWRDSFRGVMARLGGMLVAPRVTLQAILRGSGDGVEPVVFAFLCVSVCYPLTIARYVLLAEVDVTMAFAKLFAANGFVWTRLMNEGVYCAAAAGLWCVLGLVTRRNFGVWDCLNAGLYLFVPMGVLMLVGAALTRAGLSLPWLPNHPLDGWWVLDGNRFHADRFYLKLGLEMAWPTTVGLVTAWDVWTRSRAVKA